jgi:hypothetical protein
MRYVVGRDRQAAAGQQIINQLYLFDKFFVTKYFSDIPDQDAWSAIHVLNLVYVATAVARHVARVGVDGVRILPRIGR